MQAKHFVIHHVCSNLRLPFWGYFLECYSRLFSSRLFSIQNNTLSPFCFALFCIFFFLFFVILFWVKKKEAHSPMERFPVNTALKCNVESAMIGVMSSVLRVQKKFASFFTCQQEEGVII